jgi:hypothetical protein
VSIADLDKQLHIQGNQSHIKNLMSIVVDDTLADIRYML